MSRAHMVEAETRGYASCAQASSCVFARPEQHVVQISGGARSGGSMLKRREREEPIA